ncbi:hypothetical protein V6N13_008165 [Hibiscus sabdariffa]
MGTQPTYAPAAKSSAEAEKTETVRFSSATAPINQPTDLVGEFLKMTPTNSNTVRDAYDWNSSSCHRSSTRRNFTAVDVPEPSVTSKRKVEHSATLELSTSIDTTKI